jgi:DNA-binding response OmpR family regulator
MKVLLVEDDPLIAMALEDLLQDGGHEVVGTAYNSSMARNFPSSAEVAFVNLKLADGETGRDIAETLALRGVSVIYATSLAYLVKDDLGSAFGVIEKPFDKQAIHSMLDAVEEHRSYSGPVSVGYR